MRTTPQTVITKTASHVVVQAPGNTATVGEHVQLPLWAVLCRQLRRERGLVGEGCHHRRVLMLSTLSWSLTLTQGSYTSANRGPRS